MRRGEIRSGKVTARQAPGSRRATGGDRCLETRHHCATVSTTSLGGGLWGAHILFDFCFCVLATKSFCNEDKSLGREGFRASLLLFPAAPGEWGRECPGWDLCPQEVRAGTSPQAPP